MAACRDVGSKSQLLGRVLGALALWLYIGGKLVYADIIFGGNDKKIWTDTPDWRGGTHKDNVSWQTPGQLELGPQRRKRIYTTPYLYIPNSLSNDITQLDTRTGRKRWQLSLDKVAPIGDPSRTTVDINGNVWVGLRGSEKVALISRDGRLLRVIQTGQVPRAITIDLAGHVWVGAWGSNQLFRLHGATGQILLTRSLRCPYGATTDIHGNIWVVNRCDGPETITKVRSSDGTILGTFPAPGAYGIATDAKGQVWVAHFLKGCVYRFSNQGQNLGCVPLGHGCKNARGVAIDGNNNAWVACSNTPLVVKLSPAGKVLGYTTQVGKGCVGLAVDASGYIWAISRYDHLATKIDIKTLRTIGRYTTHGLDPYTYSDMTGFQFQHIAESTEGTWGDIFTPGCVSRWKTIRWSAQLPHGTRMEVRLRSAATQAALAKAAWTSPLRNGARPNIPDNPWVEVQVRLFSFSTKVSPILTHLVLEYVPIGKESCNGQDDDCDGVIDNIPGQQTPLLKRCQSPCGDGLSPCQGGQWRACNAPMPSPEVCNGQDDDCDGKIDEESRCKGSDVCIQGACLQPCEATCPSGQHCKRIGEQRVCIGPKSCADLATTCARQGQRCVLGHCIAPCTQITCPSGYFCDLGRCHKESCYHPKRPCPKGQRCIAGRCQPDRCTPNPCPTGQACRAGNCFKSCAEVRCPAQQRCIRGRCVSDACADIRCPPGAVCEHGKCLPDPCRTQTCQAGEVCLKGRCISDPCEQVRCPKGQRCRPATGDCDKAPAGQPPAQEFPSSAEAVPWWPPIYEPPPTHSQDASDFDWHWPFEHSPVLTDPQTPKGCHCHQQGALNPPLALLCIGLLLLFVSRRQTPSKTGKKT